MRTSEFQKTILVWYANNRRNLPWRRTKDPYKILVSEVMLQQTQIPRVLPKYEEFLQEFPTLEALAKAHNHKLLSVWKGLGYWKRALALKKTAKIIVGSRATNLRRSFGISLPEQLEKLPASKKILASLEKDGLLKKKRNSYAL